MSNSTIIKAIKTEGHKSNAAHKTYATVGSRMIGNLDDQFLFGPTGTAGQSDYGKRPPGPAAGLSTMLLAIVGVVAVSSALVIGVALLGVAIPARLLDGAAALLLIALFIDGALLIAGVRRRCPACRKLFAQEFVSETILDSQESVRDVPRAEAALNTDRMTGYLATAKPIRVRMESYVAHCRCSHCRHEWSVSGLRQR